MKKIIPLLFLLAVLVTVSISAEEKSDTILKIDGTTISGKILRVTEKKIEIDPEGKIPFLVINRNEVWKIIYSDNTEIVITEEEEWQTKEPPQSKEIEKPTSTQTPEQIKSTTLAQSNVTIKVGFDISGEYKVSCGGLSGSANVETAFSLSGEYVSAIGKNLGIGLGINLQLPRSIEGTSRDFKFNSLYGLLKTHLVSSEVSPYFIGQLGYNSFADDIKYEGDGSLSLKGGIYYGIGGGLIFHQSFQVEALYSVNKGSYELSGYDYYLGYYHFDFDVDYSKIVLSIGYNF